MALIQTSLVPRERDELQEFVQECGTLRLEYKDYAKILLAVALDPVGCSTYVSAARARQEMQRG